jgi:hypothetical protein
MLREGKLTPEDRFLTEAPGKWLDYRRLLLHAEGTLRFEQRDCANDGEVLCYHQDTFRLDGDCALYDSRPPDQARRIEGINPEYAFQIRSTSSGEWRVTGFEPYAKRAAPADLIGGSGPLGGRDAFGRAMGAVCRGLRIWGTWFPRMVSSPEFKVIAAAPASDSEQQLVRVQFEYEPVGTDGNNPVRSGSLVLDSERYWLIREAEVRGSWMAGQEKGTITVVNEYAEGTLTVPVLRRQVMHVSAVDIEGGQVEHDWIWEYEIAGISPGDARGFRLSDYGLPEPATARPRRLALLWLLLGLGALLCAMIARRLLSR